MDCPKCLGRLQDKLVGSFEERPFHVDQCYLCHGFWFDSGELQKALALKFQITEQADDGIAPSTRYDFINEKTGACPRCKEKMAKVPSMRDHRIKLDYCAPCDGFWTDGGEFELLMRGGYLARFLKGVGQFLGEIRQRKIERFQGGGGEY